MKDRIDEAIDQLVVEAGWDWVRWEEFEGELKVGSIVRFYPEPDSDEPEADEAWEGRDARVIGIDEFGFIATLQAVDNKQDTTQVPVRALRVRARV